MEHFPGEQHRHKLQPLQVTMQPDPNSDGKAF